MAQKKAPLSDVDVALIVCEILHVLHQPLFPGGFPDPLESIMPKKTKKKATSKLKSTRKFGGVNYKRKGNHGLKSAAKKSAASSRNAGKKARVVKNKSGYSVFTRG